jgi:hypothetical protein
MDRIPLEKFSGIFDSTLKIADGAGLLEAYRVLDGGVLIALDGGCDIMHRKPFIVTGAGT